MKFLHLEDRPQDAALVLTLLTAAWPETVVTVVASRSEFLCGLQDGDYDLILSEFSLGSFNGLEALEIARQKCPHTPFIFLSAAIGEEGVIVAVKAGAQDYVVKDRLNRLITAIRGALQKSLEFQQRQVAEQALHRFASIVESTPEFVAMATLAGRVFYVNRAGRKMIDLPANLDPGLLSVTDFYSPEVSARIMRENIPAALRDGSWVGETTVRTRDGRLIPVSQIIIAHPPVNGGEGYLSTVMHDLTRYRDAGQRIREQSDLLNKARDAIIVTDLAGYITFWNQGAERIAGWSQAEVVGRTLPDVFGADAAAEIETARKALETEDAWRGEYQFYDKAGKLLVIDISATLIRDDDDRPTARLSIGTDVTAKRHLEERFLRAQRLESIGMLAAGIAHDLNNVLAPIMMVAPVLREHATEPGNLRMLEILETSARRGAGLVRQILAFAHGTSSKPRLIQVKHLLHDIMKVVSETFPKNVSVEERVPNDLWPIAGNPTQIHQVLINLCVNARDAMPGGGKLILRAENCLLDELSARTIPDGRPGTWLVLHIEDTGSGIPLETLNHIWDPFFTTKAPDKGTGLGLSTVRGIVETHKGFVSLVSEVGVGTTFRVYLPAAEVSPGGEKGLTAHPFAKRGSGELVLVVDDEVQIRDVTAATLAHFGYRVLVAADGVEAVALFATRSSEISVVVTDLSMPNLDGAAVANVVQRLNPKTKVLLVSGLASGNHNAERQRFGGPFLLKPFNAETLLAAVYELLHPAVIAASPAPAEP